MARFEVSSAYVMGVLLPVGETVRRRTNFENIPAYIDDFIIGGLLLWAAHAASRERPYGRYLLCAAWGVLCGGLWGSFFGQVLSESPTDVSGLPNAAVVVVKAGLYAIALYSLFRSIKGASSRVSA